MNTAARLLLVSGSLLTLAAGCGKQLPDAGKARFRYSDESIPNDFHQGLLQALDDLAHGGVDTRLNAEAYFRRAWPGHGDKLVPYVAQLLDSEAEEVRSIAARLIIMYGKDAAISHLVEMLEWDNVMIRRDAAGKLRELTGQTFGYRYDAPAEDRKAAVSYWKAWIEGKKADGVME